MSFIASLCIGAFILILLGILMALGTRFLTDLKSATLELGVGPDVFVLNLNRFRYRIKLFPLLWFRTSVAVPISFWQSTGIYLFAGVGLMLMSLGCIGGSLFLASRASEKLPRHPEYPQDLLRSTRFLIAKEVVPGSPAEKAGLAEGMLITEANGRPLENGSDLLLEYRRAKDNVTLTVVSNSAEQEPTKIVIQKQKKTEPLGLVYALPPLETKPIRRFATFYHAIKAALYEATRAWWSIPYQDVSIPALDQLYWNPALLAMAAAVAFSLMSYPLIYILVGNPERLCWLVCILCAIRPGFWQVAIIFGVLSIIILKLKPAWLEIYGLFGFVYLHLNSLFNGIHVGIIKQIAYFERLELFWWT